MTVSKSTIGSLIALAVILVGIPCALISYEAKRTGKSFSSYIERAVKRMGNAETSEAPATDKKRTRGAKIDFLHKRAIGEPFGDAKPWVTHLAIADLDQNGLKDVIVCDAKANAITWIAQESKDVYKETILAEEIPGPAHVTPCDIDLDGDLDLLVAAMGAIFPNNDKIGAVIVLENNGKQQYRRHTLVDKVARVTDIRPGDFDGDGDIDLAVGQFGYDDGEIRWMENKGGDWEFESHVLLRLSGTIHTPVADIDNDGDLDILALVSQEWEEVYVFENDGQGGFQPKMIYGSTNEDFGSSGISMVDLDRDGDTDILYTNGDAFDYIPPAPRPWHGVQWLENKGDLSFEYHRIADFPGAYFANAVDVDGDDDFDVAVVSSFNQWDDPAAQAFVWYENTGAMNFLRHDIASSPTHLLVLVSDDMDGDGKADFVTGGMHAYPPFDRMSRVMLWKNIWGENSASQESGQSNDSSPRIE
jgi:hypothetical protein